MTSVKRWNGSEWEIVDGWEEARAHYVSTGAHTLTVKMFAEALGKTTVEVMRDLTVKRAFERT